MATCDRLDDLNGSFRLDLRWLLGTFFSTFALSTPLFLFLILIHEGGHGLLLVPAMILNRGAPPFTNFPSAIILLVLSIPLGNIAVGVVSWLAFKNASRYKKFRSFNEMTRFTSFFSLFLITFNIFWIDLVTGEDFALNFWEPLGIPLYSNTMLQLIISLFSHVILPAHLVMKKSFNLQMVFSISAGIGVGTLFSINYFYSFFATMLRDHYFVLVTVGLPAFLISVWMLHRFDRSKVESTE